MALMKINKADLDKLIAAVKKDARFLAPIAVNDFAEMTDCGSAADIAFDAVNVRLPVKREFFPQREVLGFHQEDGMTASELNIEKSVLFGVRPCDAKAILSLDKIFLSDDCIDPYYKARRDAAVIIVLACQEPAESCFCTSMHGGPDGREGADVIMFKIDETLLLEAVTGKGEEFLKTYSKLFTAASEKDKTECDKLAKAAADKIKTIDTEGIENSLQKGFESSIWDEIAQTCIGCGTCTYLCPTCHCFGIYDERNKKEHCRVKCQDACMSRSFTLEASGHNTRATQGARMRQRIMHKFLYTVENVDETFCVGCGRCVSRCPSNIDIRETISEVK